jgi:hypothetical protein
VFVQQVVNCSVILGQCQALGGLLQFDFGSTSAPLGECSLMLLIASKCCCEHNAV